MRKIVSFDTEKYSDKFNYKELTEKLDRIVPNAYISDFGFCPILVSYINADGNLDVTNINSGYFDRIYRDTVDFDLTETKSLDEFFEETLSLKPGNRNSNSPIGNSGALF